MGLGIVAPRATVLLDHTDEGVCQLANNYVCERKKQNLNIGKHR